MQEKSFEFIKKILKKLLTTKQNCVIMMKKLQKTKQKVSRRRTIMTKVRFNKRRFFKFMFIVSILMVGAFVEEGNITGALVLAMLI